MFHGSLQSVLIYIKLLDNFPARWLRVDCLELPLSTKISVWKMQRIVEACCYMCWQGFGGILILDRTLLIETWTLVGKCDLVASLANPSRRPREDVIKEIDKDKIRAASWSLDGATSSMSRSWWDKERSWQHGVESVECQCGVVMRMAVQRRDLLK